jgi:hypothetical protein
MAFPWIENKGVLPAKVAIKVPEKEQEKSLYIFLFKPQNETLDDGSEPSIGSLKDTVE